MYLVTTGVVYGLTFSHIDNSYDAVPPAALAGAFWPIMVPVFLGVYIARTPARRKRAERDREQARLELMAAIKRRNLELEQEMGIGPKEAIVRPRKVRNPGYSFIEWWNDR
jgi:hypothetical protein